MKILLVENADDVKHLLASQLEQWGHQIAYANNHEEALEMIQVENIQIVISDWITSESDGLELCYDLCSSELDHYVYLIMLAKKIKNQLVIDSLAAGADDYLYKPINKITLKEKIATAEKVIKRANQTNVSDPLLFEAHPAHTEIKDTCSLMETELAVSQNMLNDLDRIVLSAS